jgi:hypothetical protein
MEVSEIRRASIACACSVALCASLVFAAGSSAATVTKVASGLDNPRALSFNSNGDLFVAEAGHGSEPAGSLCPIKGPTGETECVGFTSGVSKIEHGGTPHRVLTGKVSVGGADGTGATGIDGVSVRDGTLFAVETASPDIVPSSLTGPTAEEIKEQLGALFEQRRGGSTRIVANVGHFDFNWSKEHKELVPEQFPDANPYAVLAVADGEWVIDAASNTVDWVGANGKVKVVAFIPNPEKGGHPVSDAVPTCVAQGPDGALYVSQLTGGGNGPGAAAVWRVEPWDGDVKKWATGLTAVTGCGFDGDGDFFAVEFSTLGFETFAPETGALVRVPPHSTSPVTVVSKLTLPNGFASRGDALYLSNNSIAPAAGFHGLTGEVLRVEQ